MNKKISVFGLGYVGLVTGACLAQQGNQVIGVDNNQGKIEKINNGDPCFYEPGLTDLLLNMLKTESFKATTDYVEALVESDISFISVGTPSLKSGEVDLSAVKHTIINIVDALVAHKSQHIIVMRSTVPPGTAKNVILPILKEKLGERLGRDFHYVANPEFLRESSAINDFMDPPETVVGGENASVASELKEIYRFVEAPFIETSIDVAECIKYIDNTWHALKVVFTNEVASICRMLGVDSQEVIDIFCRDKKLNISPAYFRPGFAFGGSCLPKDLRGLLFVAEQLGLRLPILSSIQKSNYYHIDRAYEMVTPPGVRNIALMGIAFKSDTDDVRESPLIRLAERLIGKGYRVTIYDKHVRNSLDKEVNGRVMAEYLGHLVDYISDDFTTTLEQGDVVIIGNNSEEFYEIPNLVTPNQIVVDLVNIGFTGNKANYQGICW
ncbi:nucleotide sugar dehydrogenase [Pseudoalteromonas sp.]|uniref:nucleotide sugar dehydrogenase n=1 Tax=Pseudoalteromonas sp. TaxID=53249 RepID=UPI0035626DA6